jgi:hypothetical protein
MGDVFPHPLNVPGGADADSEQQQADGHQRSRQTKDQGGKHGLLLFRTCTDLSNFRTMPLPKL